MATHFISLLHESPGFLVLSLRVFVIFIYTLNFMYKISYQSERFLQHAFQGLGLLKPHIHPVYQDHRAESC